MKGWSTGVRLIGILLLGILLLRADIPSLWGLFTGVAPALLALAVFLNVPQIWIKSSRWRFLLSLQQISYPAIPALLSYFSSIFVGLLTPGRLGEFVRVFHVRDDCQLTMRQAFLSVLTDRLFDLYLLAVIGGLSLFVLTGWSSRALELSLVAILVASMPLGILHHNRILRWIRRAGLNRWPFSRRSPVSQNTPSQIPYGLLRLDLPAFLVALGLTLIAYGVFFLQCYLLALALDLKVGFTEVAYSVALGSLVTLLPISISGLGTREATIIAFLGRSGVPAEAALAFSLLVFFTFYLGGGVIGAVAWWMKPLSLRALKAGENVA